MLQFPKEYFKKEVREGFLISEVMKHVLAAQLEVLQKIADICEKHGLTYYVYWGTLLGAVRHQGYIPWDDDIDIAFKGEDYVRFLEIAQEELPEGYEVVNMYTQDSWSNYFSRINNGVDIDITGSRMKEYHNCPFAVGVDIFPLYYVPRDPQAAEDLKILLTYVGQLTLAEIDKQEQIAAGVNPAELREHDEQIAQGVVDLQQITGFQFDFGGRKTLVTQLNILYDQLCRMYTAEESDCLATFPRWLGNGMVLEKELFETVVDMPFENMKVKAPCGYDTILTRLYKDYMTPKKGGGAHKYFHITEQVGVLAKRLNVLDLLEKTDGVKKNSKIKIMSAKELDAYAEESKEILPENWWNKIYTVDANGTISRKRVVLYSSSLDGLLCYNEKVIDKLKYVFNTFKECDNIVLWWFPYMLDGETTKPISGMISELLGEYEELVREYQEEDWGIYDVSGDIGRAIMMSDAYYGDQGLIFPYFQQTGKPMLCQNYDIVESGKSWKNGEV